MRRARGAFRRTVLVGIIAAAPLLQPAAGLAAPATRPPNAPQAWRVADAASSLGFTGGMAGQPFSGTFGRYEATIRFDPAAPESAQVRVTIDMTSARTGDAQKDAALPQAEWFDTARHPAARFVATTIRATGAGRYNAQGRLTIKGISRPVQLPFSLAIEGATAKLNGSLTIDRRQFAVGTGAWSSDQWVAYPVTITVRLVAQAVTGGDR